MGGGGGGGSAAEPYGIIKWCDWESRKAVPNTTVSMDVKQYLKKKEVETGSLDRGKFARY